jgi:hypothetical protein
MRNSRNVFREDPHPQDDDAAYWAGTLRSTREFPGWEAPPRRGRALPPTRNQVESEMLMKIGGENDDNR